MLIVVAAALTLAAIAVLDDDDGAPEPPRAVASVEPTPTPPLATALVTTNLREQPQPTAPVVAVIPGGRDAELRGRSEDGAWAQLSYPAGGLGGIEGWAPLVSLRVAEAELAAAPVLAGPPTVGATGGATDGTPAGGAGAAGAGIDALPDLAITNAFLLPDGRLTVSLRNGGGAPLEEQKVSLQVSSAEGEILGVLEIGPTSLAPGAVATVVTPVTVRRTGVYLLELDRGNAIAESSEFNNRFSQLLVAPGSAPAAGGDG